MSEEKMRQILQLGAIEYLLANLYVSHYKHLGASPEDVAAAHKRLLDRLEVEGWGDDPAMSDMLSDEFRHAVAAILSSIEAMMAAA